MASGSPPHMLDIRNTSTTNGAQSFTGVNHGTVNYANSNFHLPIKEALISLPVAKAAPFNAFERQHDPDCLPDTRIDLLQEIYNWADGRDNRGIYWLNGLAGTGKSTIARTVARTYYERKRLAASFFFSKGNSELSHAGLFVTSIAVQLAQNVPAFRQHICDAVAEHSDIASRSLRDQWHHLILAPLSKLHQPLTYIFIIDALDECDKENSIKLIVQLLAEARSLEKVQLRIFLTSRPEVPICHGFHQLEDTEHQDFVLHNISLSTVNHDIQLFLEYNLRLIANEHCLRASWPGTEAIVQLVQSASGLFIWAATACRFIREGRGFASKRLKLILNRTKSTATTPEAYLNKIYTTVLKNSIPADFTDDEREEQSRMLRYILGGIVILPSQLSAQALGKLFFVTDEYINQTLNDLRAIIDIPLDQSRPLRIHHPSFRDFLLDKQRCSNVNFWVDEKQAHIDLANNCIRLMSSLLKQDICGLGFPGTFIADVQQDQLERCLPVELKYACLYWVQHLAQSRHRINNGDSVDRFLQKHFLHWLEVMSLIKEAGKCTYLINTLSTLINLPNNILSLFIHDARRFTLRFQHIIQDAPLQLYFSALIFAPEASIVQKTFADKIPGCIKVLLRSEDNWDACLSVLEGHSGQINDIAFSPDSQLVASASQDKTVRVWEAATGSCHSVLKGHTTEIKAVDFSPNGQLVASTSDDETVRVWEVATGLCHSVLEGHTSRIDTFIFSPDSQLLASGSKDKTVRVWEVATGSCRSVLKGHTSSVRAVTFSPDCQLVVSASYDTTVRVWEAATGSCRSVVEGKTSHFSAIAFSPDGQLVVSAFYDEMVQVWKGWVWEAATGSCRSVLEASTRPLKAVAFSPDGRLVVASVFYNNTARVWEAATGSCRSVLEGHTSRINAVAFSPDGQLVASASDDKTVRLWEAATGAYRSVLEGDIFPVNTIAFSPDGQLVASAASIDKTVRVWEAVTESCRSILNRHTDLIRTFAFSPDSQLVASGSYDKTVRVWEVATGSCRSVLEGHTDAVYIVAFSPDGQLVASSDNETVRVWEAATGSCRSVLEGHTGWISGFAFSPDGQLVASGSYDKTVRVWEVATGSCRSVLEDHTSQVYAVAFSRDGQLVASSEGETVRVWEVATGSCRSVLKHHTGSVSAVAFSPDNRYIETDRDDSHISVQDQWILLDQQRLLWLPPEYRLTGSAINRDVVCLAHSLGPFTLLQINIV